MSLQKSCYAEAVTALQWTCSWESDVVLGRAHLDAGISASGGF